MNSRIAALAAALLACGYGAPDRVVNGVLVATQQAPGTNFGQYATFSIDPKVSVVDQTGSVSSTFTVDGTNIAAAIRQNMIARGYSEVPWVGDNTRADLQFKIDALLGDVETYSYYPGYCGWYPYYYCYPTWGYSGSYNFGTLQTTMGDAKNATPGSKIPLVWGFAGYGILRNYYSPGVPSNGANVDWGRIQEAINRAFEDSPYITRTP